MGLTDTIVTADPAVCRAAVWLGLNPGRRVTTSDLAAALRCDRAKAHRVMHALIDLGLLTDGAGGPHSGGTRYSRVEASTLRR